MVAQKLSDIAISLSTAAARLGYNEMKYFINNGDDATWASTHADFLSPNGPSIPANKRKGKYLVKNKKIISGSTEPKMIDADQKIY